MSDLISRSDVIKIIDEEIKAKTDYLQHNAQIDIVYKVQELPTVEAKPVVHCKDCEHWHEETGWCDVHSCFVNSKGEACHPWESNDWKMFAEDYFCADGKKVE